ncbi:MAG: large subunit ribosomal protein L5 [archaeon GW2011_AR17]|nr:large subunit ribosomal protein L5 [uncultured archaeon]KHO52357.1 MAG: large subunit ribosomal protein L5 [archaeon GW2011_AR17]MBS3154301.1 50S ribosomal protein L5 [Candidatus Woesearchaeota archaeon]HIH15241.1 50S ribosomal protein L5 [Nanoarchaeota archaeon]HIH58606.1 50S ribosomal protein L5 [Nanoarchaeota archaeon]
MNIMKEIGIEKVTLNVGTGKPGPELEKGKILLQKISGLKPSETLTQKRIPTWGLRPNLVIGAKVTLRGEKAKEVLKTLLQAKDNRLQARSFDIHGNFSFGIKEYLDVPTLNYIPEVGIRGFEVAVSLQRKGFRIKRRSLEKRKIPKRHAISKQDAIAFARNTLKITVIEREEAEE